MTSTIQATAGPAGATAGLQQSEILNPQAFLTLLVEQLKHQDPLNPMENQEFISQLAQLSTVEQLQSVNDGITDMRLASTSNLVGREVQYRRVVVEQDAAGNPIPSEVPAMGIVQSVQLLNGEMMLTIGGEHVPLHRVDQVGSLGLTIEGDAETEGEQASD